VDTLARCFGGGDENTAQEMGEFIDGIESLKKATGATMMVLHHTGKQSQDGERGSSALRAAADTMIQVSKTKTLITVKNNKQKDDEEFRDIRLQMKQVAVDGDKSIVLETADENSVAIDSLPSRLKECLRALADSPDASARTTEWARLAGLKDRTFHSHRKSLVDAGFVDVVRKGVYAITEKGQTALNPAATAKPLHLVKN
jgi:predicted transcriptional regulator